jgi:hypothetical protein
VTRASAGDALVCIVIPTKAEIQLRFFGVQSWTPACAGVTSGGNARAEFCNRVLERAEFSP